MDNDPNLAAEIQAVAARRLDDGRILALLPMTFGKLRLTIGPSVYLYDDGW